METNDMKTMTDEEKRIMAEGRKQSQDMLTKVQGQNRVTPLTIDDLEGDSDDYVQMWVPRQFNLTLAGHLQIKVPQGLHRFPRVVKGEQVAEHWYVTAHGVTRDESGKRRAAPHPGPAFMQQEGATDPARQGGPAPILGPSDLGGTVKVGDQERPVGQFILAAHATSGMTVDQWNALDDAHRNELVKEQVELAHRRSAPQGGRSGDPGATAMFVDPRLQEKQRAANLDPKLAAEEAAWRREHGENSDPSDPKANPMAAMQARTGEDTRPLPDQAAAAREAVDNQGAADRDAPHGRGQQGQAHPDQKPHQQQPHGHSGGKGGGKR